MHYHRRSRRSRERIRKKVFLTVYIAVLMLALLGLAVSVGLRVHGLMLNRRLQAAAMEPDVSASAPVQSGSDAPSAPDAPYESPVDFASLQVIYPDIYAYIEIPDTNISYPVFQHPTSASYYLNHNADGTYGRPAVIYTEPGCAKDFSDFNTIIYGHDMDDLSMFGTLQYYRERTYLDGHREIVLYTPEKELRYTIFAAVIFDNRYLPDAYDTSTAEGRKAYLHDIKNAAGADSHVLEDVSVTEESHIITLSTCTGSNAAERYLVIAVE